MGWLVRDVIFIFSLSPLSKSAQNLKMQSCILLESFCSTGKYSSQILFSSSSPIVVQKWCKSLDCALCRVTAGWQKAVNSSGRRSPELSLLPYREQLGVTGPLPGHVIPILEICSEVPSTSPFCSGDINPFLFFLSVKAIELLLGRGCFLR